MVMVSVGRFQEDKVRVMEGLVISENGNAARAEVARKYDGFFAARVVDYELDAGGAKHMSGFRPSRLNTRSDWNGFVVGDRTHSGNDLLDVLHFVERPFRWLAFPHKTTVLALGILRLNLRGVTKDELSHIDRGWGGKDRS